MVEILKIIIKKSIKVIKVIFIIWIVYLVLGALFWGALCLLLRCPYSYGELPFDVSRIHKFSVYSINPHRWEKEAKEYIRDIEEKDLPVYRIESQEAQSIFEETGGATHFGKRYGNWLGRVDLESLGKRGFTQIGDYAPEYYATSLEPYKDLLELERVGMEDWADIEWEQGRWFGVIEMKDGEQYYLVLRKYDFYIFNDYYYYRVRLVPSSLKYAQMLRNALAFFSEIEERGEKK